MAPGSLFAILTLLFFFIECSPHSSDPNGPFLSLIALEDLETGTFFDDFSYADTTSASSQNSWTFRNDSGGPGPSGASWSESNLSFGLEGSDTYLRLIAITQGSAASTTQSEIATGPRKFFRGTYAARIKFFDSATTGTTYDRVNQTFFLITPLAYGGDPLYSECDFEYLGQGGWGESTSTLFLTTWGTYNPSANFYDDVSTPDVESLDGWHTLVLQVSDSNTKYYVDGNLKVKHLGHVVPDSSMRISFNLWFLSDLGDLDTSQTSLREYEERVDWVYYEKNRIIPPDQVQIKVDSLRSQSLSYTDSVPSH
ncbi:hydrolase [Leptospira langatensis]|uniref:Hydrolase n=1 Tax=Leptospira langatensis TaxID=2484983 RepID=A0A5F1ZNT3_9LEPT|nr:glycoside hydrolase family 16 protein [Leptospira langatensis]TGK05373.1 hydrolase [Leptospira langatensis]TGL38509.1 hydrolase [Leptospira langatensis]